MCNYCVIIQGLHVSLEMLQYILPVTKRVIEITTGMVQNYFMLLKLSASHVPSSICGFFPHRQCHPLPIHSSFQNFLTFRHDSCHLPTLLPSMAKRTVYYLLELIEISALEKISFLCVYGEDTRHFCCCFRKWKEDSWWFLFKSSFSNVTSFHRCSNRYFPFKGIERQE